MRLRIGLHRGRPALTETGYVGISVHATARICFAAHGGQIVMSAAVRQELGDDASGGRSPEEPRRLALPRAARAAHHVPGGPAGRSDRLSAAPIGHSG